MLLNEEIQRSYYCLYRDDGGRQVAKIPQIMGEREREREKRVRSWFKLGSFAKKSKVIRKL